MYKTVVLIAISMLFAWSAEARQTEIDQFWDELSRTVAEGDFEGYSALYHENAVLVNGITGSSVPIHEALDGWKAGFESTRNGEMTASVEFRFLQCIHDDHTAHDTGIFHYQSQEEGDELRSAFIHFQALMVKESGQWKLMMEYQSEPATLQEWEALSGS